MVDRTLITTADERTWPKDTTEPVLFLGEWCLRYSRKHIWSKYDAEVAPYHWDDRTKLHQDYQYLETLYENILIALTGKLNQIHQTNYSFRYWRIVVGPWLGYFIQVVFDRWYMLKQTVDQREVSVCRVLNRSAQSAIPNDMEDFIHRYVDEEWNEYIYGQLLKICWDDSVRVEEVDCKGDRVGRFDKEVIAWKPKLREQFDKAICWFNRLFPKNDSVFLISTGFSLKIEAILQIKLKQFPKLWRSRAVPVIEVDMQKRDWLLDGFNPLKGSFEEVVCKLIPMQLPAVYLEGYHSIISIVSDLHWPDKPKIMFTSMAYSADDLFKIWSADKIETGSQLAISQHGGHFGMNPFSFHEEHQIKISDKWISWGWSDCTRPQIVPVGIVKEADRMMDYDPNGGGLMVEMTMPRYSYHLYAAPISRQYLDYFDDQKKFLQELPTALRKQVLVRLYVHDYGWDQVERWSNEVPDVRIDSGHQNIRRLVKSSRIYISTYNATTYLESLTWNIPTIMFWNSDHWEMKDEAIAYFDLLKSVGIFHDTPVSAAQKMLEVWDDVDGWWKSSEVQTVRLRFCEKFSKKSKGSLDELCSLLHGMKRE